MYLHDTLQVCLCAVISRYPCHRLDLNTEILGLHTNDVKGWVVDEVVELLQAMCPQLLHMEADLVIDPGDCAIYLPFYSRTVPLCLLHCWGKMPPPCKHIPPKIEQWKPVALVAR
ncbi:hypothetical protein [Tengunoibacter tsumagoiensis]|uniref:Uncharacterized protein n=1 Tax=Tengunoibacter tsumagoiensis TaxID=2014871 RepID=A0A401ZUH7_9CHLR|nr:hypothetical protein [Tengunoibacter tsumagoiensis]GCE10608.1 hypothetical protein KTT_04670 [Tengunoibacter tsumagoiensis]